MAACAWIRLACGLQRCPGQSPSSVRHFYSFIELVDPEQGPVPPICQAVTGLLDAQQTTTHGPGLRAGPAIQTACRPSHRHSRKRWTGHAGLVTPLRRSAVMLIREV